MNKTFDEVAFRSPQIAKKLYSSKSPDEATENGSKPHGAILEFGEKETDGDRKTQNGDGNNELSAKAMQNGTPEIVITAASPRQGKFALHNCLLHAKYTSCDL